MYVRWPILEFDPSRDAIIEPRRYRDAPDELPDRAVLCFFSDVLKSLVDEGELRTVHNLRSEMGLHPIYELSLDDRRLAVMHPCIGAPTAGALLEELIAHGCGKFIACGGAGVLDGEIPRGHVVLPTSAVRDEGMSYHYLPPGREVAPSASALKVIQGILDGHGCPYVLGKTWTTDAFYRETKTKIARRRAEGCLTVEMEAAAFFAVAQFRNVEFGQILYGGDDCSGEVWDSREWHKDDTTRQKLFWLAVEACAAL